MSGINYEEYIDKRVKIQYSEKKVYRNKGLIGMYGTVTRTSSGKVGVLVDGETNLSSNYGVYWFTLNEVKFVENESEDIKMEGFDNIAIVNLLEDRNNKDYGFALYEKEADLLIKSWNGNDYGLVVVNSKTNTNFVLGKVKCIMSIEEYGKNVSAQVVGVVNMDAYNSRVAEENRLKEVAKKKAEIEKALDEEIKKRKNAEFYEKMAKEYSDNPLIVKLVKELRELGA